MKNVACISDIHGNLSALQAVLADIRSIGCDTILCAGDIVGYGPYPNEVIECIRSMGIQTIMGNHDEAVGFKLPACGCHIDDPEQKRLSAHMLKWSIKNTTEQNREFLRSLPEQISMCIEGHTLLLVHGSVDSINEYVNDDDEERIEALLDSIEQNIYIFGHTHCPFIKQREDKMMINAGSVGRPKQGDTCASYVHLQLSQGSASAEVRKVPYDVKKAAADMLTRGIDSYFADFLITGGHPEGGSCGINGNCGCGG